MKLLKPEWITHDGKPIFSVDIHPDGSRVATGGQGDDCGRIVVWNMAPIRDEKEEADINTPRILCQMDNHLACVNCVRWSQNGKFLASGGDDKLIMIWQTSRGFGSGKSFGSSVANVEHWRPVATLRAHSGDVLDLAWSPQDVWLASSSVDNTLIIWNAQKFPEQITVLKGHSGLVKGVTWDPVGKYLASQSDDRSLRVWRTSDWKEEAAITSCFVECAGTTHVLRLNWSPDGNHIVSAHAMNNAGPTAQIIERNGWGTSLDFVGHRKAITVVKFNPKILSKQKRRLSEKQPQYSCCAIGSKDRSLSIWLTALKRPLVVLHDMFEKSILDISWSSTGLELMCCSIDGTVAYLAFDKGEMGIPMSGEEQQALLEKIYGKCILASKTSSSAGHIIESAAVLTLQQQQKENEISASVMSTPSKTSSSLQPVGDMPFKPRDKQIETRTADGRRRITPIFLSPQPDIGDAGIPAPFTSKSIAFNSSKETSKIVVEKQDRITQPGMNISSNSSQSHSMTFSQPIGFTAMTPATSTGDIKSPATEALATLPLTTAVASLETDKALCPSKPNSNISVNRQPSEQDTEPATEVKEKEKQPSKDKDREKFKSRISGSLSLKKRHGKVGRPRKAEKEAREALMAAAMSHASMIFSEHDNPRTLMTMQDPQLPVPLAQKSFVKLIQGQAGTDNYIILEVENGLSAGVGLLHRCRCLCAGKATWEQIFTSQILTVAGSRYVTCIACENKTLSIFNADGKRLFPALMLGSQVSSLECSGLYVMALTSQGYLYVWNMGCGKAVVQSLSLSSIMTESDKIIRAILTNEGVPLITLSTGRCYSFAPEIGCWMLISEYENKLLAYSDHSRIPSKVRSIGPLSSVQGCIKRSFQQAKCVFQSDCNIQLSSTISHLENQVAIALALKSASEYKFWLETYIRYLAQEGLEEKLRSVFDELLGPVYTRNSISQTSTTWQRTILGIDRHKILKQVLPSVGANLRWQRLYTEYQEQLNILTTAS